MKTIAYKDLASGTMKVYDYPQGINYHNQKRSERIVAALEDLRHTGNIGIYLIKGNKIRRISTHRLGS